jgi:hypothetical protein
LFLREFTVKKNSGLIKEEEYSPHCSVEATVPTIEFHGVGGTEVQRNSLSSEL